MKHTLKRFIRVTKMIDANGVYQEIENTIKNVEIIQSCLSQIEQEFTDTNYPNWKFNVNLNCKLSVNPVCQVYGDTIEKGLNCTAKVIIEFRCCKKKPTVNLTFTGLRYIYFNEEFTQTMSNFHNLPDIPFEVLRVICKILDETKYENQLTKAIKELKVEWKELDLNKDFKNG